MSFGNPLSFLLLLLILPMLLLNLTQKKRRKQGIEFITANNERETGMKKLLFRVNSADILFVLFFISMIIALASPRWGNEYKTENRRGLDMVLAIDISRSMNTRDCPPSAHNANSSRLEHAITIAKQLFFQMEEARFAISIGKGMGVLTVPLTWDSETISGFLETLDDTYMTGGGTNLESLVDASAGAFGDNMNRLKIILLFTDGESHEGSLEAAVKRAAAADIIVCMIGLGTNAGAPVPVERSPAYPGGFLLDPEGNVVISSRQEETLRNIAGKYNGIYTDGLINDAVNVITRFLDSLAPESERNLRKEPAEKWHLFVIAGLVFLGLSRLSGYKRTVKIPGLICLLVFLTSCGQVQGKMFIMEGNYHYSRDNYNEAISSYLKAKNYDETEPYAGYGLALSYCALDENNAALEQYNEALGILDNFNETHKELKYRINFNTGIIYFEQGNYNGAADSFRKALEADGSRADAKRNLELSLLAARRNKNDSANQRTSGSGISGESGISPEDAGGALFDFLRRKEHEQWRNEWTAESNPLWPDY